MTRKPIQYAIVIFAAIWLIGTTILIEPTPSKFSSSPHEGFSAPDFVVGNAAGDEVRLSDYRGQVILLNLWASWCQPCKAEMPAMERVYQKLGNRNFIILAVNMTQQDNVDAVQEFVQVNQITFPILYDFDGAIEKIYRMQALPTSFFIDSEGIIQSVVIGGPMPESLILSKVEQLLEE